MVNGLPGSMGHEVSAAVLRRGWKLAPFSLTGAEVAQDEALVGGVTVRLLKPATRDAEIGAVLAAYPGLVMVDYTHPSAVNENARFYIRHRIPFVMGTTGGDRELLARELDAAKLPCVVAPNMGKQIVAFQAMMEFMAQNFPGVFAGYTLNVTESHQQGKADTSGTAKAVVASLAKMGPEFGVEQIRMIREPSEQLAFGVPDAHLKGHAFHTYRLESGDGTVAFEFQHNVCGRRFYAEGSCDAVAYLVERLARGEMRRWDMMDVLRAGAMG
jgi:4-hydroxy-tetrahydrodipicolinate reductase